MLEINGNLDNPSNGLSNYNVFFNTIINVYSYYLKYFGQDLLAGPELYVDNATWDSGYTPVCTPIFKKYVIIKLAITSVDEPDKIIFQFSHELMHYVYFEKYGLEKVKADDKEESICTAASLCMISELYPLELNRYIEILRRESNNGYREGISVAEKVGYTFANLICLI